MIYAIGNSHVNIFSGQEDGFNRPGESNGFKSFPIGPTIAYNFTEHHLPKILKVIEENRIPKESKILLVVGEVDCRWHLPYQSYHQKRPITNIIDECVERFMGTFDLLQQYGYQPCGWGGHPSTNGLHNDDPNQPVFGDVLYRNSIGWYWADKIRTWCNTNKWAFYSIFPKLLLSDFTTNSWYMQDYCHLSTEKVRPFIDKEFGVIS